MSDRFDDIAGEYCGYGDKGKALADVMRELAGARAATAERCGNCAHWALADLAGSIGRICTKVPDEKVMLVVLGDQAELVTREDFSCALWDPRGE